MKLFHGTNTDFDRILLSKCRPNKDFGRGFYLTDIRRQAQEQAIRRTDFEGWGDPVVQEYEFDEHSLVSSGMNVNYRQLNRQYFFGTERAIKLLRRL